MYRSIMVPVDGSAFSREAVLQGVRVAARCGATLRLVRVGTTPPIMAAPEAPGIGVDALKTFRAHELADLYQIANECRSSSTVNVTASLLEGPVADALEGYMARHKVDLVVMRSHTRRGLARAWFGSVADKLIRHTTVPILVVRPPSLATGLENGFQFKRILVPLDGSPLAEKSLHAAIALARIDGASVTLVRVVPTSKASDPELRSPLGDASHASVVEAQSYLNALIPALSEPGIGILPKVVISDDVPSAILQLAESHEIDLIAVATHGRGALARVAVGSVADQLMRGSAISTVVIHPQAPVAGAELVPVWAGEPSFAI